MTRGGADLFFLPRDFPRPLRLGAISFVVRLVGEPHEIGETFPVTYTVVDADANPIGFRQEAEPGSRPIPSTDRGPPPASSPSGSTVSRSPTSAPTCSRCHTGEERLAQVPFWVVPVDGAVQPGTVV